MRRNSLCLRYCEGRGPGRPVRPSNCADRDKWNRSVTVSISLDSLRHLLVHQAPVPIVKTGNQLVFQHEARLQYFSKS